jgi:hypothetical protein
MPQNRSMERRRQGNISTQKINNLMKDLLENEGNEYPVADHSRMTIIVQ